MENNQMIENEVVVNNESLDLKIENEYNGNGFVRRLLNVIPVDIDALLKELDEEV